MIPRGFFRNFWLFGEFIKGIYQRNLSKDNSAVHGLLAIIFYHYWSKFQAWGTKQSQDIEGGHMSPIPTVQVN